MNRIEAAADAVFSARRSRTPLALLPMSVRPQDQAEGYRVQEAVHDRLVRTDAGELVGHKIGCTTAVMQQYLGISTPCGGGVFATGIHRSGVTLDPGRFVRVGVECEIAVRLGRDVQRTGEGLTAEDVSRAVETYMPAIELVDDRYADWRQMDAPTLIADDFYAAGCVLGEPLARETAPDLAAAVGQTFVNGVEVARGVGADVMGHPHNALAWLANNLAGRGRMLRAGEIVLTGSLVQTVWLTPGDEVAVIISGLGSVSFKLGNAGAPAAA